MKKIDNAYETWVNDNGERDGSREYPVFVSMIKSPIRFSLYGDIYIRRRLRFLRKGYLHTVFSSQCRIAYSVVSSS
jgi:hypothetical protein